MPFLANSRALFLLALAVALRPAGLVFLRLSARAACCLPSLSVKGLILVLAVMATLALDGDPASAAAKRAGDYWLGLSRDQKLDLVLGIFDGFNLNENIVSIILKNEYTLCTEVMETIMQQSDAFFADLPAGRIAKGLDGFYADKKNRNIPVTWGLWVVVRQFKQDQTVDDFLGELRQNYP